MDAKNDLLIVVGSRLRTYREYALASLARAYEIALVTSQPVTWEQPYVSRTRQADTTDTDSLLEAVEAIRAEAGPGRRIGIYTWDELSLLATASVAEKLGLRHLSAQAAAACRDKYTTRSLLDGAGLPTVRHRLVRSADEALAAAAEIGYPVVLKPRSLAGSLGVRMVEDAEALSAAYPEAVGTALAGVPEADGVLVEEFLVGPEISIDSCVVDGAAEPVFVARKRLGFEPGFEEIGHLVGPWRHEPWADETVELLRAAHRALGIDHGVTHTEVRLTAGGPRIVEVNGRLGGDLIPHLGTLATGIELPLAAAESAFGRQPDLTPTRERCAEVRFLYPAHDGTVESVDLGGAEDVPGLAEAVVLAEPGTELALPPKALTPRTAALIAVGDGPEACTAVLDAAEAEVVTTMREGSAAGLGARLENPVTRRFLAAERGLDAMSVAGVRGDDWFSYGAGGGAMLSRPVLLSAADRIRLQDDLNGLFGLLTSLPDRLFGGDRRAFAQAVGMTGTQIDLVLRGSGERPAPMARADIYREVGGFKVMELNTGSSLGGWQMAEFGRAMMQDRAYRDFAEREGLVHPDPLAEIDGVLRAQCAGRELPARPVLAITEWPDGFEKTKPWLDFVLPGWMRLGYDTVVCHLGEFEYRDGVPYVHGKKVDIVYRIFLPGEIADEQRSFDLVDPLIKAVERGDTVLFAGLDCELYGNKGSLAMLSDERNRDAFTPAELALIDRILPWTRFVRDERVRYGDTEVDLVAHVLANKDRLALKPTLLYGGVGVVCGWTVSDQEWAEHVRAAVGGPFVVQERVFPAAERFVDETGTGLEDLVVAYGVLLIGSKYAGMLARGVANPQVGIVNMPNGARIGCAFHVADSEPGTGKAGA
ncbi:ATP-grasp domain-containing protein [Kitasatospora sp. NPDC058190]|uniref:ATP-grasp domain-containing protein n=1 Tax=Kitasatospora sp. NPDC058190 TaxID=3346371 RepID=UPI0036DCA27C